MRIAQASSQKERSDLQKFAAFLLRVGSGVVHTIGDENTIPVPSEMLIKSRNLLHLTSAVFPNLSTNAIVPSFLMGRAILTPKECRHQNNQSISEQDLLAYPVELLNSINPGSLHSTAYD
ncbi:hypothetical protein PHYBLDRAFT_147515 [Phycomyces blakesleeanus NRRL 1555(-)]|uniref:Uncharacterized protein n=1 Tax=Phycomyces blakesleeanus (strain ATCC 8743b / DSM 1359 / FGSC 10004 / NBRC 33097 / NRRL 1555) TaxID=763407 RepID=A0A162X054_PHYB8|nr:hypothetical protein PHYBLDRAFT_147515 [Phycomyces blakesleeanus NRRL 1555(-)]OAD71755.1 hypothetical protein PHYBLDRAFT_147515 [Phycomyces blakesleeanus NRRL 1555(-)]|eukprot:XP_018289795.1 hypothetical protein PHYBLDRAFT_147515 [Phycomyces blakesleeanus NRRL 1555(-)]